MKIYAVYSTYYNSGVVTSTRRDYDLEEKPENKHTSTPEYDKYIDYFEKRKDADKAREDARKQSSKKRNK